MSADVRLRLTVPSEVRSVGLVGQIVRTIAEAAAPASPLAADYIELAVAEAVANAIVHAHAGDPGRPLLVEVDSADGLLVVAIHDDGPGFTLPVDPQLPDPLAEHGRGVFLIRQLVDEVEYRREGDRNVLRLVKRLA